MRARGVCRPFSFAPARWKFSMEKVSIRFME